MANLETLKSLHIYIKESPYRHSLLVCIHIFTLLRYINCYCTQYFSRIDGTKILRSCTLMEWQCNCTNFKNLNSKNLNCIHRDILIMCIMDSNTLQKADFVQISRVLLWNFITLNI